MQGINKIISYFQNLSRESKDPPPPPQCLPPKQKGPYLGGYESSISLNKACTFSGIEGALRLDSRLTFGKQGSDYPMRQQNFSIFNRGMPPDCRSYIYNLNLLSYKGPHSAVSLQKKDILQIKTNKTTTLKISASAVSSSSPPTIRLDLWHFSQALKTELFNTLSRSTA